MCPSAVSQDVLISPVLEVQEQGQPYTRMVGAALAFRFPLEGDRYTIEARPGFLLGHWTSLADSYERKDGRIGGSLALLRTHGLHVFMVDYGVEAGWYHRSVSFQHYSSTQDLEYQSLTTGVQVALRYIGSGGVQPLVSLSTFHELPLEIADHEIRGVSSVQGGWGIGIRLGMIIEIPSVR